MSTNKTEKNAPMTSDELKAAFAAQKIPLASDFAALIDMADMGCRAAGRAKDQTKGQGPGLKLEGDGRLAVNLYDKGGLSADSTNGISVNTSKKNGIQLIDGKLAVALNEGGGIIADVGGLSFKPTWELAVQLYALRSRFMYQMKGNVVVYKYFNFTSLYEAQYFEWELNTVKDRSRLEKIEIVAVDEINNVVKEFTLEEKDMTDHQQYCRGSHVFGLTNAMRITEVRFVLDLGTIIFPADGWCR